jgi:hypothetical protein
MTPVDAKILSSKTRSGVRRRFIFGVLKKEKS